MNLLGYVIVGAFVGLLAELLKKGRNWGLAGDVVVGSLTALIGGLLFGGGLWSNVVVAQRRPSKWCNSGGSAPA